MSKIQEWVYNLLVQMGLISENSSYLDNIVILLLIIAVTVGIDYSCRYIFLGWIIRILRFGIRIAIASTNSQGR